MCQCEICPVSSRCEPRCATVFALSKARQSSDRQARNRSDWRSESPANPPCPHSDPQPAPSNRNLIARHRIHRLRAHKNRLAHIAQRAVDGQRQRRTDSILIEPRNHRALAGVSLQVLRQRGRNFFCSSVQHRPELQRQHAHSLGQLRRKRRNLARPQSQPMLGLQPVVVGVLSIA
jgi:hypothetical protein